MPSMKPIWQISNCLQLQYDRFAMWTRLVAPFLQPTFCKCKFNLFHLKSLKTEERFTSPPSSFATMLNLNSTDTLRDASSLLLGLLYCVQIFHGRIVSVSHLSWSQGPPPPPHTFPPAPPSNTPVNLFWCDWGRHGSSVRQESDLDHFVTLNHQQ